MITSGKKDLRMEMERQFNISVYTFLHYWITDTLWGGGARFKITSKHDKQIPAKWIEKGGHSKL